MKRLLVVFAVIGVAGLAAAFKGGAVPGPANAPPINGGAETPASVTSTGQITSTLNPADTTFANGSIISNPAACGAGEILLGAGVAGTSVASFDCSGNVFLNASATKSKGSCTLNGGTPSTCTATVAASSKCTCSPVGTTAVIAAAGCAASLSSTTLTLTSGATLTNDVNYHCW